MLGKPIEAHMHAEQLKPPVSGKKNTERSSSERGGAGRTKFLRYYSLSVLFRRVAGSSWMEGRREKTGRAGMWWWVHHSEQKGRSLVPAAAATSKHRSNKEKVPSTLVASPPTLRTHLKYIHIFFLTLTFAVIGRGRSFRSCPSCSTGCAVLLSLPPTSLSRLLFSPTVVFQDSTKKVQRTVLGWNQKRKFPM